MHVQHVAEVQYVMAMHRESKGLKRITGARLRYPNLYGVNIAIDFKNKTAIRKLRIKTLHFMCRM